MLLASTHRLFGEPKMRESKGATGSTAPEIYVRIYCQEKHSVVLLCPFSRRLILRLHAFNNAAVHGRGAPVEASLGVLKG